MDLKKHLRNFIRNNHPVSARQLRTMRREIKNTSASFLCPNCIGGHIFHDMGAQFRSPTVNTMMYQGDFVKFVRNLDHYLSQELCFFTHPEFHFPCAHLDDITVHFTHYTSVKQAVEKWTDRAARLDRDNLFVFLSERDGLTEEDIRSLAQLPVRGLLVFTANAYPDLPYTLQIPKYENDGEVGNILAMSFLDGLREYERYFDFVKWFNEAHGENGLDVSPYKR